LQGITHVIRGQDLADAAHIMILLQVLMGWLQPVYQHHPLILGQDGKSLSKSRWLSCVQVEGTHTPYDIWDNYS
jgi:glutamyl-Q tRNA(Asp) synthetase